MKLFGGVFAAVSAQYYPTNQWGTQVQSSNQGQARGSWGNIPQQIGGGFAQEIIGPHLPEKCFMRDVDIDGNLWRSNVVADSTRVFSAAACQQSCKDFQAAGCKFFVWERDSNECTLYKDVEHIEHDVDDDVKFMGPRDGCHGCHLEGFDYFQRHGRNSLVGYQRIETVLTVFDCAEICEYADECEYVTFDKTKKYCYLKTAEARRYQEANADFDSAESGCRNGYCVMTNAELTDSMWSNYDVVTRSPNGGVEGVRDDDDCHKICQVVADCRFWTYDQDDRICYLVKDATMLEYSADKISGKKDCIMRH